MQVLVIGGTGFTGMHVLRRLVENGHYIAFKQTVTWERDNPPTNIDAEKFDYAAEDAALMRFERKSS